MSDVYILVVREPSDLRVEYKGWQATMREQLNHVAVMIMARLHRNPAATAVFDIQDVSARTIRFTDWNPANLQVIEEYSRELGLEIVLGPVKKPDTATEQMQREISHLSWRSLEARADYPDIAPEALQLVQARLAGKAAELREEVLTWDKDVILNRLLNSRLADAERRILEEAAAR